MKLKIIITALLLVFSLLPDKSTAMVKEVQVNNSHQKEKKYALLVSTESEIKVAITTAKQLFSNPKYNAKKFEVVICGKAVESLKNNSEIQPAIQEGMVMGVDFKACGISLGISKIAPDEIIKGIEVVPNGLLRIFDLQEDGYNTIEL